MKTLRFSLMNRRGGGLSIFLTGDGQIAIDNATGNITVTVNSGIYAGTYTTDVAGNTLTQALVTANRFVCFARPQISGSTGLGDTLTGTNGLWLYDGTLAPPSFTYQWDRGGVAIGGSTAITHTIVADDQGTNLTIDVTATEGATNVTATSLTTAIPAAGGSFGITYIDGVSSATPPASPTTLDLPIGATDANRWAVFSLHFLHAPNVDLISSITINGGATTILSQSGGSAANGQGQTVVWVRSNAKITTGTTASVVVTYTTAPASDALVRAYGYRLIAANAPTLVQTDERSGNQTISLTPSAGDIVLVNVTSDNLGSTPDGSSFTGGVSFRATTDMRTSDFGTIADDLSVASGGALTIATPLGRKAGIILRENP